MRSPTESGDVTQRDEDRNYYFPHHSYALMEKDCHDSRRLQLFYINM